MRQLILILGLIAASAHAADEYYTLQGASLDVGGIRASGYIVTDGFGTSGLVPGTNTFNNLVVGEDITITYSDGHGGSSSWTMCNGLSFCTPDQNNGLISTNLVATPAGLFCGKNCYLGNTLQIFVGYGGGLDEYGTFCCTALNAQNIIESKTVDPNVSITGAASPVMPRAPEMNLSGAGSALVFLLGTVLVVAGRRK